MGRLRSLGSISDAVPVLGDADDCQVKVLVPGGQTAEIGQRRGFLRVIRYENSDVLVGADVLWIDDVVVRQDQPAFVDDRSGAGRDRLEILPVEFAGSNHHHRCRNAVDVIRGGRLHRGLRRLWFIRGLSLSAGATARRHHHGERNRGEAKETTSIGSSLHPRPAAGSQNCAPDNAYHRRAVSVPVYVILG